MGILEALRPELDPREERLRVGISADPALFVNLADAFQIFFCVHAGR